MSSAFRVLVAALAIVSMTTTAFADGRPGDRGGDKGGFDHGPGPRGPGPGDRGPDHHHDNGCDSSCQDANAAIAVVGLGILIGAAVENNAANTQAQQQQLQSEAYDFQSAYEAAQQNGTQAYMILSSYPNLVAAASKAGVNTGDTAALYAYAQTLSN